MKKMYEKGGKKPLLSYGRFPFLLAFSARRTMVCTQVGPDNRFRVLYDIDSVQHAVQIVAIGEKKGNPLIVGGEEIEL